MMQRRSHRRRLSIQPLEFRRVLASMGWDGPGLGSASLTYTVSGSPDGLSQTETNAAIETAFEAWSSAADLTFTLVEQTGLRDSIDIEFTSIDGPGGTLAQAYFPDDVNPSRIAGDIQFDLAEVWEIGNSLGSQAVDLVWVAVHEIGHSLGLDHSDTVGSVLAEFVSPNQAFVALSDADVFAIRELYAAADDGQLGELEDDSESNSESGESGETDDNEVSQETDETGDTDETIDDGGLVDTGEGDTGEDDSDDQCVDVGIRFGSGISGIGIFGIDTEQWVTHFDTDGDSALSEEEVSARLWDSLSELGADADADGLISLDELDSAISVRRQEVFADLDVDGDGLLTELEVSRRIWNKVSAADTDADAAVSQDELEVYIADNPIRERDFQVRGHRHREQHHRVDAFFATLGRSGGFTRRGAFR